jgi:hypothetical protein
MQLLRVKLVAAAENEIAGPILQTFDTRILQVGDIYFRLVG